MGFTIVLTRGHAILKIVSHYCIVFHCAGNGHEAPWKTRGIFITSDVRRIFLGKTNISFISMNCFTLCLPPAYSFGKIDGKT